MPSHIAILRAGALGDVLLLRPCLWGLKAAFPELHLTVIAPGERGKLLREGNLADAVFDLDLAESCWLFRPEGPPPAGLKSALEGVDAALVFLPEEPALRAAFELLGAEKTVFHPANPDPAKKLHACEHLWDGCAEAAGQRGLYLPPLANLPVIRGDRKGAENILTEYGICPEAFLCIHPGSGSKSKNLPLNGFVALADSILTSVRRGVDKDIFRVCTVAGEADGDLGKQLAMRIDGAVALPALDLFKLAGVFGLASAYIGNDSGASHLAGQCGTNTYAVFLRTPAALWSPVGPQVKCLEVMPG